MTSGSHRAHVFPAFYRNRTERLTGARCHAIGPPASVIGERESIGIPRVESLERPGISSRGLDAARHASSLAAGWLSAAALSSSAVRSAASATASIEVRSWWAARIVEALRDQVMHPTRACCRGSWTGRVGGAVLPFHDPGGRWRVRVLHHDPSVDRPKGSLQ
jgi:hypothetical protein